MNKYIYITQEITKTIINMGTELYNSKPSVAGCNFHNKLPSNIKQKPIYKGIEGCYYSIEDYLNDEFSNTGY
jgi:hypothetical protein